jgi:enoyl-CoA hydratase
MPTVRSDDRDGGVRVLTLDRPPANAIEEELLGDLIAGLDAAGDEEGVRAIVLTGAGRFFSAGRDLNAVPLEAAGVRRLNQLYREAHDKLFSLPKPTLAMMNGHAVAGGLVLVLACDYRLGVEGDYTIGLNEVAIGASFPRVAVEIVRTRLSHQQACELMLGASLYPASQAVRLGVVDELLPAETFETTVLRRAARLAAYPRQVYAHTKSTLIAAAIARVRAESVEEAEQVSALWQTAESRAARKAQQRKLGLARGTP